MGEETKAAMSEYVNLATEEIAGIDSKRYFRVAVVPRDEFVRGDAFRCEVLNELEAGEVYVLCGDGDNDDCGLIGELARAHAMQDVKDALFQEEAEELEELKTLNAAETERSEDELIDEIAEDRLDPGAVESLVSGIVESVVGLVEEREVGHVCLDDRLEFGSQWPTIAIVYDEPE